MGKGLQGLRGGDVCGRASARATIVVALVAAALMPAARAESLCAFRTEAGALVFTNTPTKDGLCAPASKAPPIGAPSGAAVAKYHAIISRWAGHYGVSSGLVHAVVSTESAYNSGAVSPKGARGLMQLMPGTARRYGVKDSFNADENIRGGVAYLRDLLESFHGDTRLAVAAYNAGPQAVLKYSGVPPYPETQQYVRRVLGKVQGRDLSVVRRVSVGSSSAAVELTVSSSGQIQLVN